MESEFIKHFLLSMAQSGVSAGIFEKVQAACAEADEELTRKCEISNAIK